MRAVRRTFRGVAALAVVLAFAAGPAGGAESTVHLKDGSSIKGEIVSESDDAVVVKLRFGSITYKRADIKSIERGREAPSGADAAGAAGWRDVVLLKSGDEHRGLIVSEDDDAVVFDLVMSGASVSKTLTMRITIGRGKIKEVRRLTDDRRAAARAYIDSAKREEERDARGAEEIKVEQTFWDSKDGKQRIPTRMVELEHFVIEANTEEDFLRKAAHRLRKVFDAYKRHFGVDRNEAKRVRVLIFNSMEQYYGSIDHMTKHPAF